MGERLRKKQKNKEVELNVRRKKSFSGYTFITNQLLADSKLISGLSAGKHYPIYAYN